MKLTEVLSGIWYWGGVDFFLTMTISRVEGPIGSYKRGFLKTESKFWIKSKVNVTHM